MLFFAVLVYKIADQNDGKSKDDKEKQNFKPILNVLAH